MAIFLLCLAGVYLLASGADRCREESQGEGCPPVCHVLCSDGCATAPVPERPIPPPCDLLPEAPRAVERVSDLISRPPEPEKDPPRS